jgi:hypothetical protein
MLSRAGRPTDRSPNVAQNAGLPWTTTWPRPVASPAGRVSPLNLDRSEASSLGMSARPASPARAARRSRWTDRPAGSTALVRSFGVAIGESPLGVLDLLEHLAHARLHQGPTLRREVAVPSTRSGGFAGIEIVVHGVIVRPGRPEVKTRSLPPSPSIRHIARRS